MVRISQSTPITNTINKLENVDVGFKPFGIRTTEILLYSDFCVINAL